MQILWYLMKRKRNGEKRKVNLSIKLFSFSPAVRKKEKHIVYGKVSEVSSEKRKNTPQHTGNKTEISTSLSQLSDPRIRIAPLMMLNVHAHCTRYSFHNINLDRNIIHAPCFICALYQATRYISKNNHDNHYLT